MKKTLSSFGMTDPAFRGHCPQCGEVYIIRTKKDDLEGVLFSCRKVGCSGKVALQVDVTAESLGKPKGGSQTIRFN